MDRTLLLLIIMSGSLLTLLAPHATLTLTVIVTLSVLATRLFWAIVQSFEETSQTHSALD